ncbi:putative TATA-box binding protein [Tetraselmis virus 1]|uniref:Putative TATA-box binding protein n=1 Tax=Tetraselmis virus 1 TaxID=2060617 RepID=A0A2P0VN03_9VIRU|nr:putative TATA-box binding protein [Tetraselmis virus 1]AUF82287.1 putative TATA-box binding protein [Tetraselmis virus 1]
MDQQTITPYRINTMTLTAKSGRSSINLAPLADVLVEENPTNISICHVSFISNQTVIRKGNVIKSNGRKRCYSKRLFDNQATTVAFVPERKGYVNIKLFKNGQIQMTGARSIKEGQDVANSVLKAIGQLSPQGVTDVSIRLMNSDFRVPYRIDRDKFYMLMKDRYNMWCSYNPSIYLAVKTFYMFNESKTGICKQGCDGKKTGSCCKKVTIFVFHTGAVIITGAVTMEQLNTTYHWVCDIFNRHSTEIKYCDVQRH